jgi:hypothetical protein
MKLYLLIQDQYQEEDFGGIGTAPSTIHGIFDSIESAKIIADSICEDEFFAQYGSSVRKLHLFELKLNVKIEDEITFFDIENDLLRIK